VARGLTPRPLTASFAQAAVAAFASDPAYLQCPAARLLDGSSPNADELRLRRLHWMDVRTGAPTTSTGLAYSYGAACFTSVASPDPPY
jgi:hypothetical protein